MEDRTNRTIGTASALATNPLKRIPNLMNSPRRESNFSFSIIQLLVLYVIRSGVCLRRKLRPPRSEPCDYVRDFLLRHRFARGGSTPVGSAELRAPGDHHSAQPLIADQRQKGIIRDGASLCSPAAVRAVARRAVGLECACAMRNISRRLREVGRWTGRFENSGLTPARSNSVRDHINLLVGQHSTRTLCESGHGRSAHAVRRGFVDRYIVCDGQINRIGERSRRAAPAFPAMATGAVF